MIFVGSVIQSDRRNTTAVLEDIRFMSGWIMYDALSEGKINTNNNSMANGITVREVPDCIFFALL